MSKILYVITKANWGGAQRYVYDLATKAQEDGYNVAVLVGETGILTQNLAAANVRTLSLPLRQHRTFIGDLLSFGSLFSIVRIFHAEQPDIVHTNSAKAGGLGAFAARLTGVPRIVFTSHGWEFNAPRSALSKMGIRFFSWLTIVFSHTTICVSEAVRRDVAWMPWIKNKLVLVYNGVTPEVLLPKDAARRALCPESKLPYWIGMLSELNPTKRVDDAIRAFAQFAERSADSGLFIISDGKERGKLEQLIQGLGLTRRVFLLGFVKDAPRYFGAFDMFAHSSQSEALALAILEAGCASLPTVATRVGGIPEIIEDGISGMLVPAHDPLALAQAMQTLHDNPEQARAFGRALYTRVTERFSKDRMLAETFAVYAH